MVLTIIKSSVLNRRMHIELGGMFLTSFSIIEVIEKLQHVSFLVYVTPIELMC